MPAPYSGRDLYPANFAYFSPAAAGRAARYDQP